MNIIWKYSASYTNDYELQYENSQELNYNYKYVYIEYQSGVLLLII